NDITHYLYGRSLCLLADSHLVSYPSDTPCVIHCRDLGVECPNQRPVVSGYLFAGYICGCCDFAQCPRIFKLPASKINASSKHRRNGSSLYHPGPTCLSIEIGRLFNYSIGQSQAFLQVLKLWQGLLEAPVICSLYSEIPHPYPVKVQPICL